MHASKYFYRYHQKTATILSSSSLHTQKLWSKSKEDSRSCIEYGKQIINKIVSEVYTEIENF